MSVEFLLFAMRFLKGLCKPTVGAVAFLALFEGALRLFGYGGMERYLPDPDLLSETFVPYAQG